MMTLQKLKELIGERIAILEILAYLPEFSEAYCQGIRRGIQELEWVRRMMKDEKEEK